MTLLSPGWLTGLAAIPLLAIILIAAAALRRAMLARFFGHARSRPWAVPRGGRPRFFAAILLLLGLAAAVVALARPAYDPKPRKVERSGRDVVFVIDVSRSMLAQDLRPSRLDRAKLMVRDVLDVVEGDRVGIIAFAGSAVVKCPLTTDYAFARLALDELSPDTVARGGTAIGEAVNAARELLVGADKADAAPGFRDVFLFTDGEDHESNPVDAAKSAAEKGIRIVAVGLGSELVGAPVPGATDAQTARSPQGQYLEYGGKRVESRLDPTVLKRIAEAAAPGSTFLNVGTGSVELDRMYKKLVRTAEKKSLDSDEAVQYTEAFQLALAAAIALLAFEQLLGIIGRSR